jgi:hypothetical protein
MNSGIFRKAIDAINEQGAVIVFPINNKKDPKSLWSCLYPRAKMRWEWDDSADNRVVQMWHLREEISRSGQVIYSKWFQGRATCFSKSLFVHLLSATQAHKKRNNLKLSEAKEIMDVLEMDSPMSTKLIKEASGLQGKSLEGLYNKSMRELWMPGLIVGYGEVQDSSFPSLAVGATSTLFEELWHQAGELEAQESLRWLEKKLGAENLFFKYLVKYIDKQLKLTSERQRKDDSAEEDEASTSSLT